ncbi:Coronin-like protein crn1 [Malassezia equina]|uniref:Coronin n=1 Tax=Malassezia equina TaxID=1381935 RepID=A0AAF0EHA4_9BASI|nr:Coronin-like protein crn1 [Malassezia equina]
MSAVPPLQALTESAQKGSKKSSASRTTKGHKGGGRSRFGKRETLSFDEDARRDFLTGFSKRKQQRKQAAHEFVQKKIREEIRNSRLAAAEARRRQAEENVRAERLAFGLENEEEEALPTYEEKDFETNERRAHVTVQELDLDDLGVPPVSVESLPPSSRRAAKKQEAPSMAKKTKAPRTQTPAVPSGSLTAILEPAVAQAAQGETMFDVLDQPETSKKPKKQHYLSKAEREKERRKQHEWNHSQAEKRRAEKAKVAGAMALIVVYHVSNNAWDTNLMSASGQYVSLNWNVSGGGAFALLPLSSPGKLPDLYPLCRGHTSAVLDTAFSPFDDEVVVSGGDDAHLSLWRVSPDDLVQRLDAAKDSGTVSDIKPQASFLAGKRRVGHVEFHPTASNVVAAATGDHAIKLFDMEKHVARTTLTGFSDSIQSMAFDHTGSAIVATCRDRKLRLFDTRAPESVMTTDGHGGIKGARVVWCGDKPRLITTGFSKMSERQMFLWDAAQLTKPIKTVSLDSSNGIIMPFWSDNGIVFLAGKGDGNIRYYELESDELHYLTEYKSIEPQSGMAFLPRRALNVNENEIARVYKVTNSMIQPVSFYVPRKSEAFQADIFPPAPSMEPSMTATEFFDEKKTKTPNMIKLEDKQTIAGEAVAPLSMANATEARKEEAPKAEEPKAEEPKAEEPMAEEPKAEAPAETPEAEPKAEAPAVALEAETKSEAPAVAPKAENSAKDATKAAQASTVAAAASAAPTAAAVDPPKDGGATNELEQQLVDLRAQLSERDTRIRELEMENLNIRQLLRADAEAAKSAPESDAMTYAQRTMSLLLLASLSRQPLEGPDMPSKPYTHSLAANLSQRIVRNLASLSYHHLSPHTQMQPLHRRAGGSSSNTNKKPGSAVLDALLSHADELETRDDQARPAGLRLDALTVTPKPVRGPVQYRHTYWDGQHTDKHVPA